MLIIAKHDKSLPTLKPDTHKQIISMILNLEQINARDDKELKKVITGGFGSGKSVVGQEIVKRCYAKALKLQEKSILYYICCDHFSLFQCEMQEFTNRLKKDSNINSLNKGSNSNVKIVCKSLLELWRNVTKEEKISLPKLLQYYSKKGNVKVNFVLEELPGEYVQEKDANQLKKLFSSHLKKSLVVFIPKSIVKNRYLNIDGEKQILESNFFDEEKIGMKIITLETSMRVTECIQSLIDSAQDTIRNAITVLFQPNNGLDQLSKINSAHEKYNESNSNIDTLDDSKCVVSAQDNVMKSNAVLDQQIRDSIEESTKTIKQFENRDVHATHITTPTEHKLKVQPKDNATTVIGYHDDDLDQGAKIIANLQKDDESKNFMETKFDFKSGVIGHSFKGEIPQIIFLPILNLTEERSAKILSVVLEKICFNIVRKTAVICNNMQEVGLVAYAIDIIENYQAVVYSPHLQKHNPEIKEKKKVFQKIKGNALHVLVADSRAMCGAESEAVIVFVKPEEYYLRHEITDVCARCNSHLIIMVLPPENKVSEKDGTIKEVLENWSLKKIVQIIQVEINNDEDQLCRLKDYSYYINDQCIEFKSHAIEKNFINYIEDKRFKVYDENNAL